MYAFNYFQYHVYPSLVGRGISPHVAGYINDTGHVEQNYPSILTGYKRALTPLWRGVETNNCYNNPEVYEYRPDDRGHAPGDIHAPHPDRSKSVPPLLRKFSVPESDSVPLPALDNVYAWQWTYEGVGFPQITSPSSYSLVRGSGEFAFDSLADDARLYSTVARVPNTWSLHDVESWFYLAKWSADLSHIEDLQYLGPSEELATLTASPEGVYSHIVNGTETRRFKFGDTNGVVAPSSPFPSSHSGSHPVVVYRATSGDDLDIWGRLWTGEGKQMHTLRIPESHAPMTVKDRERMFGQFFNVYYEEPTRELYSGPFKWVIPPDTVAREPDLNARGLIGPQLSVFA